ncbi:MAG: MarR family transcriptional regulator [Planctomycetaceae bacterium]|nr:MarR family transcriptional regulator [Planctomycetaceae bacterium]
MPQPSELDAHLGFWLRFVSNHVSHAFARKVEAHGVTVAEWVILRQLLALGEVPPSRLAEGLGMTRGAISKLIDRLLNKKLVTRSAGKEDRRFQSVSLTAAGRNLVPKLAALADRNDGEFFGHLTDAERDGLADLLKDVVRRHGLKDIPTQ